MTTGGGTFRLLRIVFLGWLFQAFPGEALVVGQDVDLLAGGVRLSKQVTGLLEPGREVGALVTGPALVERLAHGLVSTKEPPELRAGRSAGRQKRHLVALAQPGEHLLGRLAGGLEPRPAAVDHRHAGGVVQHNRDGRGPAPTPKRSQAGERGPGQAHGDQQQYGYPHCQKRHVLDVLAPARPLDADPEKPERAIVDHPGLLAMDQVHEDRNQPGERGQQEERGSEGHGRVRFSR